MKGLGYCGIWGQNWKPGHYQPKEGLYDPQHPLDNSVLFFFQQLQNTAGSSTQVEPLSFTSSHLVAETWTCATIEVIIQRHT